MTPVGLEAYADIDLAQKPTLCLTCKHVLKNEDLPICELYSSEQNDDTNFNCEAYSPI